MSSADRRAFGFKGGSVTVSSGNSGAPVSRPTPAGGPRPGGGGQAGQGGGQKGFQGTTPMTPPKPTRETK